jgi:hypothetical protein
MQVVCINGDGWQNATGKIPGPLYGDMLLILDEERDEEYHGYYFARWQTPFLASEFIPLSSIDETEMERNYKTEKV